MELELKDDLSDLIARMHSLEKDVMEKGERWAKQSAHFFYESLLDHLGEQGRPSGVPPPLSGATWKIYSTDGEPDGEGISNHIEIGLKTFTGGCMSFVGILNGKPTMIAKVQNDGAVIPVTDAMRGYLSAKYGIHLRADTSHIFVPARHFWTASLEKAKIRSRSLAKQILKS